jgi:hypothetical protein
MQDRTWITGTGRRTRVPRRLLMAASALTVACLLATGCTSATGTTRPTPPSTGAIAEWADATWQGTFQVDGRLTDGPAHVGSVGCTAIGYMALDLRRGATGTRGSSVSGRLRVWAVTTSGTTGTACGRRDLNQGSMLGTLSSDGNRLQGGSFHLLGVAYGRLTATIANTPAGAAMQEMQGQFGDGRSDHRSLHGTFTLARADPLGDTFANSQPATSPPASTEPWTE